jgi:hypothetical protein
MRRCRESQAGELNLGEINCMHDTDVGSAAVEPLLRAGATAEIDTRLPPQEVADELERIARAVNGRDL